MKSGFNLFPAFLLSLFIPAAAHGADWSTTPVSEYDSFFQRTNGWLGADGNYAVALTNNLTVWLFSDTFVGEIANGRRTNATMINNSAAWQRGTNVEFFYGKSVDAKPAALITPADGKGWFWLFDGVMAHGRLFLFLAQVERTDGKSAFGFRHTGSTLGDVSNPFAPPTQWRVAQKKIPFTQLEAGTHLFFGAAAFATNGFVYVFGTRERRPPAKTMVAARAPEGTLDDFSSWRFRTRDGWATNAVDAADLCDGMASEYSVSWLPALQQFVLVYSAAGLSDKILVRTAANPWGPWSEPSVVYRCPEASWGKRIFCYAAKAHPMLASTPDELIITYAANSFDFGNLFSDPRLYWPRFVRAKMEK